MPELDPATSRDTQVILVGGHETRDGADLAFLTDGRPDVTVTVVGRPLSNTVTAALARSEGPVVVVPMTFGRNPTMVADVAKTLRWLTAGPGGDRLALAGAFGTLDHLTAWLRKAATDTRRADQDAAIIVVAPRSTPFDDAELHRIAHLVRAHGAGNEVAVVCHESSADIAEAARRLRLLGFDRTVVVPASFARSHDPALGEGALASATFYGPLMTQSAVRRVVGDRVRAAVHDLGHGRDGVDEGLAADHGHGYAHSHAFELGEGDHSHAHGHSHSHPHRRPHSHSHGSGTHPHDSEGSPDDHALPHHPDDHALPHHPDDHAHPHHPDDHDDAAHPADDAAHTHVLLTHDR